MERNMIIITLLADHPETIPTLCQWFRAQWPAYYAERTLTDIAQDFAEEANRTGIDIRLVAFADGELAGTITLREEATWTLPEYGPGLGGLLVTEPYRGRGIGSALVTAGMNVAREQGFERVYATTTAARGILERLGWHQVQVALPDEEHGLLYEVEL